MLSGSFRIFLLSLFFRVRQEDYDTGKKIFTKVLTNLIPCAKMFHISCKRLHKSEGVRVETEKEETTTKKPGGKPT